MSSAGVEAGGAAAREQVLARRVAVYGGLVAAGSVLPGALCALIAGWRMLLAMLSDPLSEIFWVLLLPGPAAALGAAAVHRPFMRAVRRRRAPYAHGWAVAGMLAAHVAYAALLAGAFSGLDLLRGLGRHTSGWGLLGAALSGLALGADALVVGFLPNVLVAEAFAGVMLRVYRRQSLPRLVSDIQSTAEGASNESAAFAE